MADEDMERTERATGKKRSDLRNKGQVFKSRETTSAVVFIVGVMVLHSFGSDMIGRVVAMNKRIFSMAATFEVSGESMHSLLLEIIIDMGVILIPFMMVAMAAGLVVNIMQVGLLFTTEPFGPDFSKLNPISGMKKFVSLNSFVELLKSSLKLCLVGYISYVWIKDDISTLVFLPNMTVLQIVWFIGRFLWSIVVPVIILMAVIAALDFIYQKYDFEKSIRMTKQEVKEEFKQQEGDPQIKGRILSLQREAARKRMMAAVPDSTVIITNPTHIAVALKYDQDNMAAPKVIAKGAGFIAAQIREVGKKHKVPLVEDKPLAWAVFRSVEVGEYIPEALYKAVAQILAYVFRLKGKKQA